MSTEAKYDIHELPQDQRVLTCHRYQKPLYYAAQTGIWTGHLYFTLRLLSVLFTPSRTWQIWTMLLVEGVFFRESPLIMDVF